MAANTVTRGGVCRLYNKSRQRIGIQVKPPEGDFFMHEQTVYLDPGKTVVLPKAFLNEDQVKNLQAARRIQVIYDSGDQ